MKRLNQIKAELIANIITKAEAIHDLERLRICSDWPIFYEAGLWQRELISEWELDNKAKWNWSK